MESTRQSRAANLLGAAVLALHDRLREATEEAANHGAAGPAALVTVGKYPGRSIEHLRGALGLTHSGAVRLVDRLVDAGLLRRFSGSDRRSRMLELTPAGHAVAAAVGDRRLAVLDDALSVLDDAEQASLEGILQKLLAALVSDRRSVRRICRLCDEEACTAEDHRCPTDAAASG